MRDLSLFNYIAWVLSGVFAAGALVHFVPPEFVRRAYERWNFLPRDRSCRIVNLDGKEFAIMRWMGPNKQFIEKWKRAAAHVFFSVGPYIFYLAGPGTASRFGGPLKCGEFALCALTRDDFVRAVRGENIRSA